MNLDIVGPDAPKPLSLQGKPAVTPYRIDREMIAVIASGGGEPILVWTVVRLIVERETPRGRAARRQLCSRLLCRLRSLLSTGKIERTSKSEVRLSETPPAAVAVTTRRLKNLPPVPERTVAAAFTFYAGGPLIRSFTPDAVVWPKKLMLNCLKRTGRLTVRHP